MIITLYPHLAQFKENSELFNSQFWMLDSSTFAEATARQAILDARYWMLDGCGGNFTNKFWLVFGVNREENASTK